MLKKLFQEQQQQKAHIYGIFLLSLLLNAPKQQQSNELS